MRFASTRRLWFQRLGSLAVVPYLLLAIFGEALHSHPLLSMAAGESQSTLQARGGQANAAPSAQQAHVATQHNKGAAATLECAACLWLLQTMAHVATAATLPPLRSGTAFGYASAAATSFSPSLTARPRGPPLN